MRNNHFNLIRMLLAAGVLLCHCFPLTQGDNVFDGEPWYVFTLQKRILGTACVLGFFILSGYLVSQSLERSSSLWTYFRARAVRIYPAAIVCAVFTALFLGPLCSDRGLVDYLRAPGLARFIIDNATLSKLGISRSISAAFVDNPIPYVSNGSTWTLPWELLCYVLLIPCGLALYRSQRLFPAVACVVLLAGFAVAASVEYALHLLPGEVARPITFFGFFAIGVLGRIVLSRFQPSSLMTVLAFCVLLLIARSERFVPSLIVAVPFLLGFVLLSAATCLPRSWLRYNKIGDFSYGLYLYAWPVQQSIVHAMPGIGPWTLFATALPTTLLFAVASWRLVEQPALRLKIERNVSTAGWQQSEAYR